MNSIIFFTVFCCFALIYFLIGFCMSKKMQTTSDYFLAGRTLGAFSVTFMLIATQLGGNFFLGAGQQAYQYGLYGLLYAVGISIGFLVLSAGFAARLRAMNVATVAELFEVRYNSRMLKQFASAISIVSLCGVLISIIVSSKALMVSVGFTSDILFLLFWLLVIVYTMIGGLHAVVVTDIFQVLFIVASIGSIFLYSIVWQPKGFVALPELFTQNFMSLFRDLDPYRASTTLIMPILFSLVGQDLAQSFFAAKSQRVAVVGAFFAGLFIILFGFIPVYFGMQARVIGLDVVGHANPFVVILDVLCNEWVFAAAMCGIMAAITSTADSLLCAISSNITQDFNFSWSGVKSSVLFSQGITLITGLCAVGASYVVTDNILDIAIGSYGLVVSCLLVSIVCALYKKNLYVSAAYGAAFFGFSGFVLCNVFSTAVPAELVSLLLSVIGYFVGHVYGLA